MRRNGMQIGLIHLAWLGLFWPVASCAALRMFSQTGAAPGGSSSIPMPDIIGLTRSAAQKRLVAGGKVGDIEWRVVDSSQDCPGKSGLVYGSSPGVGTMVQPKTPATVYVCP